MVNHVEICDWEIRHRCSHALVAMRRGYLYNAKNMICSIECEKTRVNVYEFRNLRSIARGWGWRVERTRYSVFGDGSIVARTWMLVRVRVGRDW